MEEEEPPELPRAVSQLVSEFVLGTPVEESVGDQLDRGSDLDRDIGHRLRPDIAIGSAAQAGSKAGCLSAHRV